MRSNQKPLFKTHYFHSQPGEINILSKGKTPIFEVISEFGIGKGSIELMEGDWPRKCIIRLHLHGLEGFSLLVGDQVYEKSEFEVKAFQDSEKGYYEVKVPRSLLPEDVDKFSFSWVDFYR